MTKAELIKRAEKEKWTNATTPGYLLPCVGWMRGFMRARNYFNEYLKELILVIREDGLASQINDERQMFRNLKELYDFPDKTRKIIGDWRQNKDDFYNNWSGLNEEEYFDKISDLVLGKTLMNFFEDQTDVWSAPLQADSLGIYSETELYDQFYKILPESERGQSHDIFAGISQLTKISFLSEERISILRPALLYKNGSIDFKKRLSEHQVKYFWIKNTYRYLQVLPVSHFEKLIEEESRREVAEINMEIKSRISWPTQSGQIRKDFFANHKIETSLKSKLELTPILGDWLDERKEFNLKSNHFAMLFAKEAAKRLDLKVEEIYCLLPEEIDKALSGKIVDNEELERRSKSLVYMTVQPDKEYIYSGQDAQEIIAAFDEKFSVKEETKTIKGMVASRGKEKIYVGKVRIVHDIVNDPFESGEILVTSSTRPEFVPLMRKALCIVTDEGGIASHAAIVSRELGKPCVIGTKTATKILKSGDSVEVDIESGVVKVIG